MFRYIHHLDVSKDLVQVTPKDGSIVPIHRRPLVIISVGHEHPLGALSPIRVTHRSTAAVWTGFSEKPAFQNHSSVSGQRLLLYQQYMNQGGLLTGLIVPFYSLEHATTNLLDCGTIIESTSFSLRCNVRLKRSDGWGVAQSLSNPKHHCGWVCAGHKWCFSFGCPWPQTE